jgi:hypothetical protein
LLQAQPSYANARIYICCESASLSKPEIIAAVCLFCRSNAYAVTIQEKRFFGYDVVSLEHVKKVRAEAAAGLVLSTAWGLVSNIFTSTDALDAAQQLRSLL